MLLEAVLTFMGLILGTLFYRLVKDEVSSGRKYFFIAYKILLFVLLVLSLYYAWFAYIPYFLVAFLAGIIFSFGIKEPYFYLGALFLISSWQIGDVFFMIVMVTIFAFGLVRGTLISEKYKKKKNILRKIIISAVLFSIPFVLLFYKSYFFAVDGLIFSVISGALFMEFIRKINL